MATCCALGRKCQKTNRDAELNLSYISSSYVSVAAAGLVFEKLVAHAQEHDAPLRRNGSRDFTILLGGSSIDVAADNGGVSLRVSADSESALYFLKEAAVCHLAELNAEAADALRWDDTDVTEGLLHRPANFHEMVLRQKSEPSDGMIRIRLVDLKHFASLVSSGVHVKLLLPLNPENVPVWPTVAANGTTKWPTGEDMLHVRYYTIRNIDRDLGELDIDIVRHAGGVVADWAESAKPGDKIGLMGPGGGEVPESVGSVLLAGDQTALPALARMVETLPSEVSGQIIGAARTREDLQAYLPSTGLRLHALRPDQFQNQILKLSTALTAAASPEFAWFAGEHETAQEMRKLFKAKLGLPKGRQFSISYWRKGDIHDAI